MSLTTGPDRDRAAIRVLAALVYGAVCHGLFGIAVLVMVAVMGSGMTWALGTLQGPLAWLVNLCLLAQFVMGHSILLSSPGRAVLKRLAPSPVAADMAPTTYVIIASAQLLVLFACWSPSGIVWWQPDGWLLVASLTIFGAAWALLLVSNLYSGIGLQSGYIGWSAVLRGSQPRYPDMPTAGPFRHTRNPIYVSFALATWTAPVSTPDKLVVAVVLTAYCLIGPGFKEARMRHLFGDRFAVYARSVPYWWPRLRPRSPSPNGAIPRGTTRDT